MRYIIQTTTYLATFLLLASQSLAGEPVKSQRSEDATKTRSELRMEQETPGMQSYGQTSLAEPGQGRAQQEQALSTNEVRQIQSSLEERGFNPGPVDGVIGPNTRQALKQFQQEQGLAATGRPNPQTLQALDIEVQFDEYMGVSPEFGTKQQDIQQREKFDTDTPQNQKQQDQPVNQ